MQNAQKMWLKALTNLVNIPLEYTENAKSICAFISQNDVTMEIYKDFAGGEPGTVVNRSKSKIIKKNDRKPRVVRNGPMTSCPDCCKCFSNPYSLQMHLRNSDRKDACPICGVVLLRGAEFKKHLEIVHNESPFLCKECLTVLITEADFNDHEKNAHKEGALTCNACGRTFTRQSSFANHLQMHLVLACRRCGSQFTNRSCYREHRSLCEPNAKPLSKTVPRNQRSNIRDPGHYVCDYCQKSYTSRCQLKNHILWIHLDHRPHQCSWCGKRFYTAARLNEHSVVHTRVRNFECDICGLKLVSKSAAIYHRRRHTGEKPYVCDDCGAAFISSSRRLEHAKRKHNKGIRFQCTLCPASFVRKRELEKHSEKNHKRTVILTCVD